MPAYPAALAGMTTRGRRRRPDLAGVTAVSPGADRAPAKA